MDIVDSPTGTIYFVHRVHHVYQVHKVHSVPQSATGLSPGVREVVECAGKGCGGLVCAFVPPSTAHEQAKGMVAIGEFQRMWLVGDQRIIRDDDFEETMGFYGDVFRCLHDQAKATDGVLRCIGFQSALEAGVHLHFLGVDVDDVDALPAGMVGWELDEESWTVRAAAMDGRVTASCQRLEWIWWDRCRTHQERRCGEFEALLPGPYCAGTPSRRHRYWMSAQLYLSPDDGDGRNDEVYLVEYDPSWPREFQEMAAWLRGALGPDVALRIEHYGSTAIPGMPAKPIVDILVQVPSFLEAKRRALPRLGGPEWEYWSYLGHMTFIRRTALGGRRTHHIHMAPQGHELWRGVAFRDYLALDDAEAARYAALKRQLASTHREDRERYTRAKTDYVQRVTAKALQRTRVKH